MGTERYKPYAVVGSGMSHAQMVKQQQPDRHTNTGPNSNTNRNALFVDVHHRAVHITRNKTQLSEDSLARFAQ